MNSASFESETMCTLYDVMTLLTRAQALLDKSDETLIAAQLSSVIDLIEARIGSPGDRPN